MKTQVEVWEKEEYCGMNQQANVSTAFFSSPKLPQLASVSIEQLDYELEISIVW